MAVEAICANFAGQSATALQSNFKILKPALGNFNKIDIKWQQKNLYLG
jgi:hypothetical protein